MDDGAAAACRNVGDILQDLRPTQRSARYAGTNATTYATYILPLQTYRIACSSNIERNDPFEVTLFIGLETLRATCAETERSID